MSVPSESVTLGSESTTTIGSSCLPFGCLLFSLNRVIISFCGIASGNKHHDPTAVTTHIDSLESECLILDTVSL